MSIKYLSGKIHQLIIVQAIILLALISFAVYKHFHASVLNIDLNNCTSEYAQCSEGQFFIDENCTGSSEAVDALTTDNLFLKSGSYTLHVDYECLTDMPFCILDGTNSNAYLKNDTGYLRSTQTSEDFKFRTITDLDSLVLKFRYEPFGYLSIKNLYIVSNTDNIKRLFVLLFAAFAVIDTVLLFPRSVKNNKYILLGLSGIVAISSLPLLIPGMAQGHDLIFALLRIETEYLGLKEGSFPVRMSSLFLKGYGYPVSVYYGDIFLYIPAFLRMLGFSVLEAWKLYILSVNIATAAIGYLSFNKISKNRYVSLALTCAYLTAPYRLSNIYVRAACGEFTAMTFYPLIACILYKIYTENLNRRLSRRYSSLLALGISAVVCSHILSTEMLFIVLLAVGLILYKKTFSKAVLSTLFTALIKTLIISAYFIVPFIDYYFSVPAAINDTVSNSTKTMQEAGAYLTDYIGLSHSLFNNSRIPSSPGIALIICLITGIALYIGNRNDKILLFSIIMSSIILLAASNIFPWDYITANSSVGKIISQIQLPTRFIGLALVFLVMVSIRAASYERSLKHLHLYICLVIAGSLFTVSMFTDTYEKEKNTVFYSNTCDLDTMNVGNAEYARLGTDIYRDMSEQIQNINNNRVTDIERKGSDMILSCVKGSDTNGLLVPHYNYKGYHIYDEYGNEYRVKDGDNNLISFTLPAEYEGSVFVRYVTPIYWNIAIIISVTGFLFISAVPGFKKKRISKEAADAESSDTSAGYEAAERVA